MAASWSQPVARWPSRGGVTGAGVEFTSPATDCTPAGRVAETTGSVGAVSELARDQRPQPWTDGAAGYAAQFERYTGLYADAALARLGVGPGTTVLDVAAGTGMVTRKALALGAHVVATDFSEGMLRALGASSAGAAPPRAAMDAGRLAVATGSVDVTVSMFGVIFVPDPVGTVSELRRATRPGGAVGVGTWWAEGNHLGALVIQAVQRAAPGFSRPPLEPARAALAQPDGLAETLVASGLAEVEVHPERQLWRFDDPEAYFLAMPSWSPTIEPLVAAAGPEQFRTAAHHFAALVAECSSADGLPVDALVGIGRVPA